MFQIFCATGIVFYEKAILCPAFKVYFTWKNSKKLDSVFNKTMF
jgi:hypothetical protein